MLKKALFRGFTAMSVGLFGYISYKTYKKSQRHVPLLQYQISDDLKLEKNKMQYNLKTRADHISDISKTEYDILVVGGGCNGAGVLLEAASRGLKGLLVETYDFASGTSSKSTKLIHGGVRYLEEAFSLKGTHRLEKIELVREALTERSYMVQNAQYMNHPLPIVIPANSLFSALYYYAGCLVYHMIYYAFDDERNLPMFPFPYLVGKDEIKQIFPHLSHENKYGVVYYDGQMNDARMNIDLILTSTVDNYLKNVNMTPSNAINYTELKGLIKDNSGKIIGANLFDKINQKEITVKAKSVVNCTGIFADEIRRLDNPEAKRRIVPAQGSHIILDKKFVNRKYGLIVPKTTDGRVLFVLPWLDQALAGTTDLQKDKPEVDPTVSFDEMVFMVKELSRLFPEVDVTEISSSIKSKWAGARPLVMSENTVPDKHGKYDTKTFARTHVIERTPSGLISLMGGKWTTYRKMSEETIDEVVKYLSGIFKNYWLLVETNQIKPEKVSKSVTKELRLLGQYNKGFGPLTNVNKKLIKLQAKNFLAQRYNLDPDIARYLLKTYGERAYDVAKLFDLDKKNRERLTPNHPMTVGELRYNIRYEMAMKPTDFLFRRTRLGFIDSEAINLAFPKVIDIFAEEYKWSAEQKNIETKANFEHIRKMNF